MFSRSSQDSVAPGFSQEALLHLFWSFKVWSTPILLQYPIINN